MNRIDRADNARMLRDIMETGKDIHNYHPEPTNYVNCLRLMNAKQIKARYPELYNPDDMFLDIEYKEYLVFKGFLFSIDSAFPFTSSSQILPITGSYGLVIQKNIYQEYLIYPYTYKLRKELKK